MVRNDSGCWNVTQFTWMVLCDFVWQWCATWTLGCRDYDGILHVIFVWSRWLGVIQRWGYARVTVRKASTSTPVQICLKLVNCFLPFQPHSHLIGIILLVCCSISILCVVNMQTLRWLRVVAISTAIPWNKHRIVFHGVDFRNVEVAWMSSLKFYKNLFVRVKVIQGSLKASLCINLRKEDTCSAVCVSDISSKRADIIYEHNRCLILDPIACV